MLTSVGEATQCRSFSSDHGLVPDLGLSRFLIIVVRDVNHDIIIRVLFLCKLLLCAVQERLREVRSPLTERWHSG